ncbi:transposase [Streptomyces mirabilis]|uniref:transposase n=1 Tax=Streptomyces mirabilis TaxID=68239 RepID=UPI0033B39E5D
MTDAEWVVVRPLLPVPGWTQGEGGQPEAYCHRVMLDAIGYSQGERGQAVLDQTAGVAVPVVQRLTAFETSRGTTT